MRHFSDTARKQGRRKIDIRSIRKGLEKDWLLKEWFTWLYL